MHTKVFIDNAHESWDSSKKSSGAIGLQLQSGCTEWILKRKYLTRLNGSSMETFPILSASTVPDMRRC